MVVQKLVLAFVTAILGIVLLTVIATNTNEVTGMAFANNESITLVRGGVTPGNISTVTTYTLLNSNTGSDSWKNDPSTVPECIITNFVFKNQTGHVVPASAYTLNTATGTFTLNNVQALNTSSSNATAVNYNYCPDDYLSSSFGRSSVNLIAGFFAIALMAVSLGIFYSIAKETGMIQ